MYDLPIQNSLTPDPRLYVIILIDKRNITDPATIIRHELTIPRRPLVPRVRRQHTLYAHADALDRLHGRPAGRAEQVETDDAVAVDVGVHWDWAWGVG